MVDVGATHKIWLQTARAKVPHLGFYIMDHYFWVQFRLRTNRDEGERQLQRPLAFLGLFLSSDFRETLKAPSRFRRKETLLSKKERTMLPRKPANDALARDRRLRSALR